jgi:lysozyme
VTDETRADLIARLKEDEGTGPLHGDRFMPYTDTVGVLTVGYGRAIGRIGISEEEAELLLTNDIERSIGDLNFAMPWWSGLDEVRQMVLVELRFQLGLDGLLGFRKMREALRQHQYGMAADDLLDSLLATQAPNRIKRLAAMLRTGLMA